MNRFLTKKKAKRAQPEPKFELDLSTALPSSNEFRTSLLMPGLSSRFSMLREQDDPNSKLGKASDDSVLEPKRQSRLYDFGFKPTGLSDIAEVSSISSSVRPPFANERTMSYASDNDYGTDGDAGDGSIMNRARQGDGNVLFGGRQKITRLGGDGTKGRTLYDDDVAKSTFQKWRAEERQREKEAAQARGATKFSFEEERKSPTKAGSNAPSVSGSLKRQTSSSTSASGMDSRSSTAATSINSQGPPSASLSPATGFSAFNFGPSVTNAASSTPAIREHENIPPPLTSPAPMATNVSSTSTVNAAKRRLYDQGLNRDMQDQQSNAMNRLHSINKRPMANGRETPEMFQGRNVLSPSSERATNTGELGQATSTSGSAPGLQRKPTLTGLPGRNVKIDPANPDQISPLPRSPNPPISPNPGMQSDQQQMLASAVNPNDRGKATALGVFNKPKQFNEQQFLDRQMALRKGRDTPTLKDHSIDAIPESPVSPISGRQSPEGSKGQPSPISISPPAQSKVALSPAPAPAAASITPSQLNFNPVGPPPVVNRPGPSPWDRSRSVSNGPFNRARSTSTTDMKESPTAPTPFSAFQRAANQVKGVSNEASSERKDTPQMPSKNKFNFVDESDSDYDEEAVAPAKQTVPNGRLPPNARLADDAPLVAPPQHEHPMFRNSPRPSRENLRVDVRKPSIDDAPPGTHMIQGDVDSPTLPAATGNGLSGMIRHLREHSATSTYSTMTAAPTPLSGPSVQTRNLNNAPMAQNSAGAITTAHSSYSHSNPWDLEDFHGEIKNMEVRDSVSMLGSDPGRDRIAEITPLKQAVPQNQDAAPEPTWQQELSKKTHNRGGSTETQQEREALANELAARQKAIQEKMRERNERDMRSGSPGPSRPGAPFMGILRQKSSFDNFRSRDNSRTRDESRPRGQSRPRIEPSMRGPDKAARILGVNGSSISISNQDQLPHENARNQPRSAPMPKPRPSKELQQAGYGTMQTSAAGSRPSTGRESSEEKVRSRSNSNTATAITGRGRSNSELSNGRSRSRQGRYRDDEATIPEHFQAQTSPPEQVIPEVPESPTQNHSRKTYVPIDAAHFEQKGLWPPPQNPVVHPFGVPSPRPSPGLSPSPAFGHPNADLMSPVLQVPARPWPSDSASPGLGNMSPGIFNSGRATPISPFANHTPPISSSSTPTAGAFPSSSTPNLLASASMKAGRPRKMSVKKSEIGDPVLISTTSVVDTIDLPIASLRNGMDAPPVPPINPRRKRFAFGRADTEPPQPAFANPMYGSGSHSSDESPKPPRTRHRLKKSSSDGAKIGLYVRAQQEGMFPSTTQSTPALAHLQSSPPRMQNGMF